MNATEGQRSGLDEIGSAREVRGLAEILATGAPAAQILARVESLTASTDPILAEIQALDLADRVELAGRTLAEMGGLTLVNALRELAGVWDRARLGTSWDHRELRDSLLVQSSLAFSLAMLHEDAARAEASS